MTYRELLEYKEWCRETGHPFEFEMLKEWPKWDVETGKPRR